MLALIQQKAAENGLQWKPATFNIDFEMSAIRAIQHHFPDSKIKGCLFHYSQCLWRKVQSLGLASEYNNYPEVKTWVRLAVSLAMVPENCIDDAFFHIQDIALNILHPDVVTAFHDYLTETWIDDMDSIFPKFEFKY